MMRFVGARKVKSQEPERHFKMYSTPQQYFQYRRTITNNLLPIREDLFLSFRTRDVVPACSGVYLDNRLTFDLTSQSMINHDVLHNYPVVFSRDLMVFVFRTQEKNWLPLGFRTYVIHHMSPLTRYVRDAIVILLRDKHSEYNKRYEDFVMPSASVGENLVKFVAHIKYCFRALFADEKASVGFFLDTLLYVARLSVPYHEHITPEASHIARELITEALCKAPKVIFFYLNLYAQKAMYRPTVRTLPFGLVNERHKIFAFDFVFSVARNRAVDWTPFGWPHYFIDPLSLVTPEIGEAAEIIMQWSAVDYEEVYSDLVSDEVVIHPRVFATHAKRSLQVAFNRRSSPGEFMCAITYVAVMSTLFYDYGTYAAPNYAVVEIGEAVLHYQNHYGPGLFSELQQFCCAVVKWLNYDEEEC